MSQTTAIGHMAAASAPSSDCSPKSALALAVRNLSKRYGATVALRGVDLDVRPGEIVGLMGENGAGKSTLVGLLAGVLQADDGEIVVNGQRQVFRNAHEAQARGISTVYQHLALARHLDVAENLFLGRLGAMTTVIRPRRIHDRAAAVLSDLGWDIDPYRRVGSLPTSDQQLVEVARAIASQVRVLLLDEPTSSLTPIEVEGLFQRVRDLARSGIAVIFVSHQLDEIFDLVDSVAVLRDGRVALRCPKEETNSPTVVGAMLGTGYGAVAHRGQEFPASHAEAASGTSVFQASDWSRPPAFREVSFTVESGVVVALTGLRGCGAVEVAAALFNQTGLEHKVRCLGRQGPLSSAELIKIGVGYVPADRTDALFPDLSLRENLELARRVARAQTALTVDAVIQKLAIRARDAEVPVRQLSGGNQQKVLMGRWLVGQIKGLILVEPTRGVDIGVRADIHRLIRELASDGLGVLLVSFDAEEIEATASRVLVMHRGRVGATLEGRPSAGGILTAVAQVASTQTKRAEA